MADEIQEPGESRATWERRWSTTQDEDFEWSLPGVAPQLQELVQSGTLPAGGALDLGCGAGASTDYLAGWFSPSVGIDFAVGAVQQAAARRRDTLPFLAADATLLPFAAGSFALVFDRGCLQNLPRAAWAPYFAEVERVLQPGGTLQLLVSRATPQFPSVLSGHGLRLRWAWYVKRKRGGPQFLTHDLLRQIRPPSLDVERVEDVPFVTKKGKGRLFTHALYRKG